MSDLAGESVLEVDLLRHGEPLGGRRYRGDGVDDPLDETGWRQMWSAVGGGCSWRRVMCSPLRCAREFAEALAAQRGIPCAVDDRWREVGMGAWEGLTREQAQAADAQAYAAYHLDPLAGRPAGAESLDALRGRVAGALDALQSERGPLLVVAHAVVIRAAIAHAVQGSTAAMMRIPVAYAGMTRLRRDGRGWALVYHQGV